MPEPDRRGTADNPTTTAVPLPSGRVAEITAVIPTHNRPELLSRALASVRSQTYPAAEILIVDEASDPAVASWLVGTDAEVIRHETPRGPATARNVGAARAHGSHVAFLDDDDIWLERKLESVVQALEAHPTAGAVFHQFAPCRGLTLGTTEHVLLDDPLARMLGPRPPHSSALVVARDIHLAVQFDSGYEAAEDLDYNVRLAAATHVVEILDVLACSQSRDEGPSEIAIETRIRARERFRAQHAHLFTSDRFERHHQMQLAHLHRRAGHRTEAIRRFASLTRQRPRDIAPWKGLISSLLPPGWSVELGTKWRGFRGMR